MKLNKLLLTALAASLFLASCSDDDNNIAPPSGDYVNGLFILNQGGFGHGDASVSFLSNDFELENNIFAGVNPGHILGDTGQDIGLTGEQAYIVMNFSNKIEVVNRYNFEHITTIEAGLDNPRYIAFASGKAYVTNWGDPGVATDDFVAVINLTDNTVITTIPVAEGPERIVEANGKLYVAHAGGYGFGNTVSVIDSTNSTLAATINVGYVPNSLEVADGKLYVMNGGVPSWSFTLPESAGSMSIINLANNTVSSTVNFSGMVHPMNIDIEAGNIYYTVDS
jgi:YVTN family beta-propeller protein